MGKAKSKVPLWAKALLVFKPLYIIVEREGVMFDKITETRMKHLFGKPYILSVRNYLEPPTTFNCRCLLVKDN